jgi:hypothetical protein
MREILDPMALYARLMAASADLSQQITYLGADHPFTLRLEAAWLRLDDLIEQLPEALAWEAQHQPQEEDD